MIALQVTWFLLVGVLIIGYAVLDGFDLGVGFWHLFAKRREERSAFIESIEPFWDGNEVWLLTGGGALFAAFPPVYATVFSGFYLALILVLVGLIFRAVAIEYRNKVAGPRWEKTWDVAFAVGSILPSLLYGVAIGNVLRGLELNEIGDYTAGFFALLNPFSLLCGLVGLTMFARHGALYLAMKLDGDAGKRARGWAAKSGAVFSRLLLVALGWGLAKHVHGNPVLPIALAVVAVLASVVSCLQNRKGNAVGAFMASALTIAGVMLAVATALFPYLVPCVNDDAWSLTVFNASSSRLTLTSMLIIALIGMPIVLAYTVFIHRVFRGKIKVK